MIVNFVQIARVPELCPRTVNLQF